MTVTTAKSDPARPVSCLRPATRLAQQITGRPYLSYSQISLMRSCPRKFAFSYIEKVPPDFVSSSLIFGSAIHRALELYYRCRLEGTLISKPGMMAAYLNAWRSPEPRPAKPIPVRFNKGEDERSLSELADRILTSFLASPLAEPKGIILGIEEEITIELDATLPDLLARVDLVTETDNALHVIDFKTSRSRWTDQKAQEAGQQLLLYGLSVQDMCRSLGRAIKLHFAIITKAKKPVVQLIPVANDGVNSTSLTESVGQIWQAIQSGNFYPSPSPQNCSTCPYRSRCPAFTGQ
jgi:putative RecB family exonuclease